MIYPDTFEEKIGFSTVREMLSQSCLCELGRERVEEMKFSSEYDEIRRRVRETSEMVRILQEEDFPDRNFFDVRDALKRIRIERTFLDEKDMFDLQRSLQAIIDISSFLNRAGDEESSDDNSNRKYFYPALQRLSSEVAVYPHVVKRIGQIIDQYGNIKDTASPELGRIRRELAATAGSISRSLQAMLKNAKSEGLVDKDAAPTVRDGRLVIPVAPAMKRKVKGIVHDESDSGRTVYIEPAEVVEANNRVRELESEERREIIRILMDFTATIRPEADEMLRSYSFLADVDFVRAKAKFAITTSSVEPSIENKPGLDWSMAMHPLLQMSLARQGKKVVPLEMTLNTRQRILLISGPNAGGKSVCLKTVGLLQYMMQCGMLVPMSEGSRMGVFGDIFLDIGDEQSIEDDLSTYSSHLLNMKITMKRCGGTSLILIDEFGSGTEPQIGGAMAEAVLKRFNAKRAFGVITTHYQNLKHFAEENEGVVNGAMLYDRKLMRPLFELRIGNPGSSFAVEIARKIGIPEDVIADASDIVGREYINADKYLQDIVRDKRYWEGKRQTIRQREKHMEETIERYQTEIEDLQKSRKDILRKAKEEVEQLMQEANARIENTIRSIKEAQAEKEKTRQARQELTDFRESMEALANKELEEKIARKMEKLKEKQNRKKEKKAGNGKENGPSAQALAEQQARKEAERLAAIVPGCNVRIKGQTSVGEVMEVNGKNAIIAFGSIKTTVKLDRLERTNAQPKQADVSAKSTFISVQTQDSMYEKKLHFKQDIDVRGMRGDEALQAVTYFIDDAILVGMSRVRILHGTGTGILRTLIRQYLETVPGVRHFADEHIQFGGAGITVVDLS